MARIGPVFNEQFKSFLFHDARDKTAGLNIQDSDKKTFLEATVRRGEDFTFEVRKTAWGEMWSVLEKASTVAGVAAMAAASPASPPTCTGAGRHLQYDGGWRCVSQ